jgi:hypothetical protein
MIEHNITIRVNENIDKIMEFICYYMDAYIETGRIKSIRKVETHEMKTLENNEFITSIKRYYFFTPILPDFINSLLGDSLDLFLTYGEEILFDFENKTSTTMMEQVNSFYSGKYDVKYTKIDEKTTDININFNFELQIKSYSMFSMSAVIETIVSQILIAEMKNFYNNLEKDIKELTKTSSKKSSKSKKEQQQSV